MIRSHFVVLAQEHALSLHVVRHTWSANAAPYHVAPGARRPFELQAAQVDGLGGGGPGPPRRGPAGSMIAGSTPCPMTWTMPNSRIAAPRVFTTAARSWRSPLVKSRSSTRGSTRGGRRWTRAHGRGQDLLYLLFRGHAVPWQPHSNRGPEHHMEQTYTSSEILTPVPLEIVICGILTPGPRSPTGGRMPWRWTRGRRSRRCPRRRTRWRRPKRRPRRSRRRSRRRPRCTSLWRRG